MARSCQRIQRQPEREERDCARAAGQRARGEAAIRRRERRATSVEGAARALHRARIIEDSPMPKSKAPAQTFEEPTYLTRLVHDATPIEVHMVTGERFAGTLEYWDADFIRLTRTDGPNLFIYKRDIRYIVER